jgi:hypothetical protein
LCERRLGLDVTQQGLLQRSLPGPIRGLLDLALDLRWSWDYEADRLWSPLDGALWRATRNPWLILQTVPRARLEQLAADRDFRDRLEAQLERRRSTLANPSWFQRVHRSSPLSAVAYFSMEFGLIEASPCTPEVLPRGEGAYATVRGRLRRARRGSPRSGEPRARGSYSLFPLTVITGQDASRTVRSATLPSSTCFIPVRPRVPITIKSEGSDSASSRMAVTGAIGER